MPFKPNTLVLDNTSGYYDLALNESLGDSNAGLWGKAVNWGPITGSWRRDIATLCQINRKWKTNVIVIGHIEPKVLRTTVGYDDKGKPIKDGVIIGWQVAIPGKGQEKILVPFDEVYHLTTLATEVGINPHRKLFTNAHTYFDFTFEAKSRKKVIGPITNPTYEKIVSAVSQGFDVPSMFMLVGAPGSGKTTLAGTFPSPRLFIDIQGGCDEEAKKPDTRVFIPNKIEDIFSVLRTLRDKGELP